MDCTWITERFDYVAPTGNKQENAYKNKTNKLTVTSKRMSFRSLSNINPSSPPYCVDIKTKAVPEAKSNEELPSGIVGGSTYYPLVIDDFF